MSDLSDLVVQVKDWVLILGAWGVIPSRMQRKKVSTLGFGLTQQEGAAKSMLVSFSRQIVARSYSVQAGRWVSVLILDVPKENISYLQDQLTLLPDCSCPSLRTCGPWRTFLLRSVLQQTVVKEGAVLIPIPRCSCADSFISLLLMLFSCQVMSDSVTPWTAARQASLSLTISQSFLKFTSIASAIHPTVSSSVALFSFCLQSFPASGSFLMSWLLHQVAKVLELQFHFLAPHQGASLAGDPPVMGVIWLSKVPWGIIKLWHQLNATVVTEVVAGGLCSQMKLSSSWTTQTHLLLLITCLKKELGVFLRGRGLLWNQRRLTWMRPAGLQRRPSQRRKLELTAQSLSASAPHLVGRRSRDPFICCLPRLLPVALLS